MKTKYPAAVLLLAVIIALVSVNCSDNSAGQTTNTTSGDVPDVYKKIYGATELYIEGNYVVIKSNGRPEHKSPYYLGTQWESTLYEAYNGPNPNFQLNPNRIAEFSMTYKIPLNPVMATNHQSTPGGPIGVALNGVPFFNQYAAGGQPLTNEINSFEQYNGHPQQFGQYHYHVEPVNITNNKTDSALVGFLLDGFPVYGPLENGVTVTNNDLDAYHGHFGVKEDYPAGIYHYHITTEAPYLNGDGYYGTPGTVTY
jgi:hypothetical protein